MGFYFNGYDINGSPLTYNTNYLNIIESWWNNANILNGTLTVSPNILSGSSYSRFSLANAGGYDTLEELNLSLIDLTTNDFKTFPEFSTAYWKSNNLKNFSYSINNIENGDFYNLRESYKDIISGSWCPNLSNNGLLNILNFMDEMYSKTNISSWPNQMFRESSLLNITLKNFTYDEGAVRYFRNAFCNAKVVNLNFENFKAYSNPYISLSYLFYGCQNLRMGSLNENFFSILDNTHSNNMIISHAFRYCHNLTEIPNLYNVVITNAYYAFINTGLTAFPKYTFSNCNGTSMLEGTNLIEISNLKYTNANFTSMYRMFSGCYNLTKINNVSIKNVSNLEHLFIHSNNLSQISNLTIERANSFEWGFRQSGIKTIDNLFLSNISDASCCFYKSSNLSAFTNSIITQIIDMSSFFVDCNNLRTLPNFDFSKTTNAMNMFIGCKNLSTDSLNYFGMVLPNRSNLTNISTYNLSYFGLTNDQINIIASNTAARMLVQSKGWEIANLEPKRTRVTQFAQMNNNALENIKIGMDAEYVTLPGGILNFLPNEVNILTALDETANYLKDQINIKYRAFDISFDIYDLGEYDENIDGYQYTFNQHINTRIYSDTSENGENLRNYIEQYTGYNGYNSYYIGNLSVVERYAPNFINAYNMFFGASIG